jgi:predicted esterase
MIALGDREHTVDAWIRPLCGEFAFSSLEAPRTADPRRFGVPTRSGDWYLADERGPEPSSFGLALIALERFVLHEQDRAQAPPILLGVGQGATLALALAQCWAEVLGGVIAIDGQLPELPAGAIEETPLTGLPFLIVGSADPVESIEPSHLIRTYLTDRGGCVTLARALDAHSADRLLAAWLTDVRKPSSGPGENSS